MLENAEEKEIARDELIRCQTSISCFLCACWLDAVGATKSEHTIFH